MASCASASLAFPFLSLGAQPKINITGTRVISLRPNHYHGWPTLARRMDGELLLVCSGGRESHVCPFGQVELMRSKDGGQTWLSRPPEQTSNNSPSMRRASVGHP
jgi:hypothetical protein